MHPLRTIELHNFCSFTTQKIRLGDITCVVGPNESGKTNLLDAIWHLAPENQERPFDEHELCMGAAEYPRGNIEIAYDIHLSERLLRPHGKAFAAAQGASLHLTKQGTPAREPQWLAHAKIRKSSIPKFVRVLSKKKLAAGFSNCSGREKQWARQTAKTGWFIKTAGQDLRRQPFHHLADDGAIELVPDSEKLQFYADQLKDCVLNNIRIFRWQYEEGDFLPERVEIAPFIEHPGALKTVESMFRVAGWSVSEFGSKLQTQGDTVYGILFEGVQRDINSLIRRNWSTHGNLRIALEHKGEYFTIRLQEPGSKTPPEYRSDGLKRYLTFLINFRGHSDDLKDHILLMDEPGLHLHPRGQKDILRELQALSSKHRNQVIYATHQTFLINKNRRDTVRVLRRETDRSGKQSRNPFYASFVSDIADKRAHVLTDKLLREALGFQVSDISPINEKNVLTEGVFDRDVLHAANMRYQVLDLNEVSIIACGGATRIATHASLYKANGLKVACLYDSDEAGRSAHQKNDRVTDKEKLRVADASPNLRRYETLEDLLPEDVFDEAYRKWLALWKITGSVPTRPRVKGLEKHLKGKSRTDRLEMKHALEDLLVAHTRGELKREEADFEALASLLKSLNQALA